MSIRIAPLLALLAGCFVPHEAETADTAKVSHPCKGARPGVVAGFEEFVLLNTVTPLGEVDALNWAWKPDRVVTVNLDAGSFAVGSVNPAEVRAMAREAIGFWNGVADIELVMGDDNLRCCFGAPHGCDRECGAGDELVDIFLEPPTDEIGRTPARMAVTQGDDPLTTETEEACLVGGDVTFSPRVRTDAGQVIVYDWVLDDTDVIDVDSADGTADKPLHNTLVHELGHLLGLGEQTAGSVGCSVMSHCRGLGVSGCACSFDAIESLDVVALTHLYGP